MLYFPKSIEFLATDFSGGCPQTTTLDRRDLAEADAENAPTYLAAQPGFP
jgi:hypothetical protein